MKLIISTCGTSILTNNTTQEIRNLLNKYTNSTNSSEVANNDLNIINQHIQDRKAHIINNQNLQEIAKLSAELNGILRIYNFNIREEEKKDFHMLICTGTYLGEKCAEIVKEWLEQQAGFSNVQICKIKDLKTDDIESFHFGISELVKFCDEILKGYKQKNYHIIFNLTGGFKSIQGIMLTIGMFYADECVYVFETGEHLLRIPKIPVELNIENTIKQNINLFRKLSLGISENIAEYANIGDNILFIRINNEIALSAWGELVWRNVKDKIYSEELLQEPISKIRFSESFKKQVNDLPKDRIRQINLQIDKLCRFITRRENPDSLNFKPLRGNPQGNSTHEFYAWSDRDAKRIFCHYEGEEIVIDNLGEHL